MSTLSKQVSLAVLALGFVFVAVPAVGQEYLAGDDFLTPFEVDRIREAQDPNDRIEAYLHFAALRLELVDQLMAKDEAGRGAQVHDNLDEYGRILEAVDMVIEDALLRDEDVTKGMEALVPQQEAFLERLTAVQEKDADDLWRYEFVLEDAIEITSDSLELALADLGERKREIIEDDEAEKAAREAMMTAQRRAEMEKARKEQQAEEAERERKRPSLLGDDETLDEANQDLPKKK